MKPMKPLMQLPGILFAILSNGVNSYTPVKSVTRRDFASIVATGSGWIAIGSSQPAEAFVGSGSSAYSGRSPATKAAQKKQWQERIVADVQDFNALGAAIGRGETDGPAWINFFILQPRREPDPVGRTYAALADFRGLPTSDPKVFQGGDGFLLANTFTKAGKPPENTPAVKAFAKLTKAFDPILAAGKNGDATRAKSEWEKASALFSQYLREVELPDDLKDPLYQ